MKFDRAVRDELLKVELFGALSAEQLAVMQDSTQLIRMPAKQTLFECQQIAEQFFLLRNGQIKLFNVSPGGSENVLEIIQPGQTFAEAIMFMEQHRYPVCAETIENSELYAFDMRTYRRILAESSETCFRLLADMSRRLHGRLSDINNLVQQNATCRIIYYLLQQLPDDSAPLPRIHLSTPKSIIASRLAIQPETLSRTLYKLRDQGLIDVQGNDITLQDLDGLRALL